MDTISKESNERAEELGLFSPSSLKEFALAMGKKDVSAVEAFCARDKFEGYARRLNAAVAENSDTERMILAARFLLLWAMEIEEEYTDSYIDGIELALNKGVIERWIREAGLLEVLRSKNARAYAWHLMKKITNGLVPEVKVVRELAVEQLALKDELGDVIEGDFSDFHHRKVRRIDGAEDVKRTLANERRAKSAAEPLVDELRAFEVAKVNIELGRYTNGRSVLGERLRGPVLSKWRGLFKWEGGHESERLHIEGMPYLNKLSDRLFEGVRAERDRKDLIFHLKRSEALKQKIAAGAAQMRSFQEKECVASAHLRVIETGEFFADVDRTRMIEAWRNKDEGNLTREVNEYCRGVKRNAGKLPKLHSKRLEIKDNALKEKLFSANAASRGRRCANFDSSFRVVDDFLNTLARKHVESYLALLEVQKGRIRFGVRSEKETLEGASEMGIRCSDIDISHEDVSVLFGDEFMAV